MDNRLKIGLIFMVSAVLLIPLALFFNNTSTNYAIIVLIITMLLELIGLIFVILSIVNKKKTKK